MAILRSLCVYCGSRPGDDPVYAAEARRLGALMAARDIALVYGGGGIGLMGVVADAVMNGGGKVVGIIPDFLRRAEAGHDNLTELIVVDNMHERKMAMFERADAFAVLPGGVGTLEELFEILSWRTLALHDKPIVVIDVNGFWTPLHDLMERTIARGFVSPPVRDYMRFAPDAESALATLEAMPTATSRKPLDKA